MAPGLPDHRAIRCVSPSLAVPFRGDSSPPPPPAVAGGSPCEIPVVRGVIDRILVITGWTRPSCRGVCPRRSDPNWSRAAWRGFASSGSNVRPPCAPSSGISSENAAHRIAVEWDDGRERGRRLHPSPRHVVVAQLPVGGRLFPGDHHHARFDVEEHDGHYRVALDSDDRDTHVVVAGVRHPSAGGSIFGSLTRRPIFSGGARWATRRRGAPARSTGWTCGASPGTSTVGGPAWSRVSSTTGSCSPKAPRTSTAPLDAGDRPRVARPGAAARRCGVGP